MIYEPFYKLKNYKIIKWPTVKNNKKKKPDALTSQQQQQQQWGYFVDPQDLQKQKQKQKRQDTGLTGETATTGPIGPGLTRMTGPYRSTGWTGSTGFTGTTQLLRDTNSPTSPKLRIFQSSQQNYFRNHTLWSFLLDFIYTKDDLSKKQKAGRALQAFRSKAKWYRYLTVLFWPWLLEEQRNAIKKSVPK